MAIKSKKWKPFISFGTFFLGVSLAAAGIGQTADRCFGYSRPGVLTEVFARDYQNTEDFRWQMAGTLSDFLAMATGVSRAGFTAREVVSTGMITAPRPTGITWRHVTTGRFRKL